MHTHWNGYVKNVSADDLEKLEHTYISGDNAKRCHGKQFLWFFIELIYDPAILSLVLYPQELKVGIQKNLYTDVHRVILF